MNEATLGSSSTINMRTVKYYSMDGKKDGNDRKRSRGSRVFVFCLCPFLSSSTLVIEDPGSLPFSFSLQGYRLWIPAFAGMTEKESEDPEFLLFPPHPSPLPRWGEGESGMTKGGYLHTNDRGAPVLSAAIRDFLSGIHTAGWSARRFFRSRCHSRRLATWGVPGH